MANTIQLKSISELFGENFFIPSYQRGYRWTEQQVNDLLNDIYTFATRENKSKEEFYCLQPIVVKRHEWERDNRKGAKEKVTGWEVIDGQQRLTTIKILLNYFINKHLIGKSFEERFNKEPFNIFYSTREDSESFLNNITENDERNIDFYHISSAYTSVINWFKDKSEKEEGMLDDYCDAILRTLVYNMKNKKAEGVVQVIWYQIEDESESSAIDTFIRINMGKISLSNSELIKALFLQNRNFGDNNDIAKLRQLEIANEWDQMENKLQNEDFWWFLNKEKNNIPARIGFIFDIICNVATKNNKEILKEIGTDHYSTFRFFNKKFEGEVKYETIKKEWDNIKEYYLTFEDWYNDTILYHYIGFLIFFDFSIVDIYELINVNDKLKIDVIKLLKGKISSMIQKVKLIKDQDNSFILDLYYGKNNELIRKLLLLFNLEYIIRHNENKSSQYKFPFKLFKGGGDKDGENVSWDIEHIDSHMDNDLKDKVSQIDWLKAAKIDIPKELATDKELSDRVDDFIYNKDSKERFNILFNMIAKLADEDVNNDKMKNHLGNLTLLDASINRAYRNALFITKRRYIIEKDMEGKFIPICTRYVFLKYFDNEGKSRRTRWSAEDMKIYRNSISKLLIDFLPKIKSNTIS